MSVSEKFDEYFNSLSKNEQIDAANAVIVLCDDHEKYMERKEKEMKRLLQQALEAAANLDLERLAQISAEVEKRKRVLSIEEFIEIHFGL